MTQLAILPAPSIDLDRVYRATMWLQVLAIGLAAYHDGTDNQFRDPLLSGLLVTLCVSLAIQLYLSSIAKRASAEQADVHRDSQQARSRTEELFGMTDMLQAAETYDDAGAVLQATARKLLPEHGVALYVFNNSRDRLDLARSWDLPEGYAPSPTLSPNNCWALKRGKTHVNVPTIGGLCCSHHAGSVSTVEIPMMACGQLHGLLVLARGDVDQIENPAKEVLEVTRLGRSLADSMSLALSNIALREKLRTQSLRDPLTGLYNRRYMEDALERFLSLGSRNGSATSVIMLDLDNFKSLNDQYGHAKGDAVLRDAAAQIVGALRPSDVTCRYGGEELMAILPDCGLEDAALKADQIRARIAALSELHGCAISASFGVACMPESAGSASDILPQADAALYAAKLAGKNRVHTAESRMPREASGPRLAVTGKR
ncbi:GGDEF domain-containing protein [Novosphingobium cyanobacteriorum]|uniref:diguanylate cyclase n=1 Tax=Novosphingobium cyanobacteriorum TaxID=3024215 RepID=A0ABT6CI69_9SPHN|nr:diguanylate cyclase [Novosphingobium cyanobacteriorum]MDF8333507.1 diguanylate cyclase [Novosphingobium cyanobacteriorum]